MSCRFVRASPGLKFIDLISKYVVLFGPERQEFSEPIFSIFRNRVLFLSLQNGRVYGWHLSCRLKFKC